MLHVVNRIMSANGARRLRGEVIDTEGWRNLKAMLSSRYVLPLPAGVDPAPCGDCGRLWADSSDVGLCCAEAEAKPVLPDRHPTHPPLPKPAPSKGRPQLKGKSK